MGKNLILAVVALCVGAVGGALALQSWLAPQLAAATLERDRAQQECAGLGEENARMSARVKRLEGENESFHARLTELQEVSAAEVQLPMMEPDEASAAQAAPQPVTESPPLIEGTEPGVAGRDETGVRTRSAEDRQTREARRAAVMTEARQRADEFMNAELDRASDPVVRERLATLHDHVGYMVEVMDQLREATNEEERQVLQETFDQTRETVRGLVQEQQDYMLRQVVTQYGISDGDKQERFITTLRETQESPFFRAPLMMWGFGRPQSPRGPQSWARPPSRPEP